MGSKLPRSVSCPHSATCGTPAESIAVYGAAGQGVRGMAAPDMVGHHGHLGVGRHGLQTPSPAAHGPFRVTCDVPSQGLGVSEGQVVVTYPLTLSSDATPATLGRPSLWAETPSQAGDIPSPVTSQ